MQFSEPQNDFKPRSLPLGGNIDYDAGDDDDDNDNYLLFSQYPTPRLEYDARILCVTISFHVQIEVVIFYSYIPRHHTQSFLIALKQELYHWTYFLHAINGDCQYDCRMSSDRLQHSWR